ncbi:MAG: exodeoxyribonuclease V subunit beta [Deltaproteobacteria bacterium]|nr:exodeoxyribonuclease V subunit beta [Deltaproteobacteria bacterium]
MKEFDLLKSPFYGTNLIEANAGTGKTYTITALFLRLLLERRLDPDNILAVTFTHAAAYELKERIRQKIYEATKIFSYNIKLPDNIKKELHINDPFLLGLYEKHTDKKRAFKLLNAALTDFDTASVFTIHGFCRRILDENSFESGASFDTALVADADSFLIEIAEDFWRKNTYKLTPLYASYLKNSISIKDLYKLIKNIKTAGLVKILPDYKDIEEIKAKEEKLIEEDYNKIIKSIKRLWEQEKNNITNILENEKGLNRNKYRKTSIPYWLSDMEDFLEMPNNPFLFDNFFKFTSEEIEKSTKKNSTPVSHPFFILCDTLALQNKKLLRFFDAKLIRLKLNFISYFKHEHKKRKKNLNIRFFDDLITELYNALQGKSGEKLIAEIKKRFKAAMIDEFQDTDRYQYEIFSKIFGKNKNYPLFLIGDPKQAIYGFRGADIFTYIKAAKKTDKKYTLKQNRRSSFLLIEAINSIFKNNPNPFLYKDISFIPSSYNNDNVEDKSFTINNIEKSGIKICLLKTDDKKPNKDTIQKTVSLYCANEIANLIKLGKDKKALIDNIPLEPKDIAVLTRTNKEALLIQKTLMSFNIKSILYNTGNIFETEEAYETAILLAGIINHTNSAAIKSALTCKMFGLTVQDIYNLKEDDILWGQKKESFREYNNIWKNQGFIKMFNYMAQKENFFPNLITRENGERRITNLIHVTELLNNIYMEKKTDMFELTKLLEDKIASAKENSAEEEALLRLESDENAVVIVTIHKSKGLEYPIVFAPFISAKAKFKAEKNKYLKFHDQNGELYLDIGSNDFKQNKIIAEKEILAENIRLLYVAATRAKYLCYLGWQSSEISPDSATAYLLQDKHPEASDDKDPPDKTDPDYTYSQLKKLEKTSEKSVKILEIKEDDKLEKLQPVENTSDFTITQKKFSGKINRDWEINSFSSIASSIDEQPDFFTSHKNNEKHDNDEKTAFFESERGAGFGIFIHDILEHTDFSNKKVSPSIAEKLSEYGYPASMESAVSDMIKHLTDAPLDLQNKEFILSNIDNQKIIKEFEFYFPIKPILWSKLSALFKNVAGYDKKIKQINKNTIKGFMRGFIDMVFMYKDKFYIIDWKSNWLGDNITDYNQDAMLSLMTKNHYILQYHIYTAALDRYLKIKIKNYDYEKHFGKIFYIFLRGINKDKSPEFGVSIDRPSKSVITKLNNFYFGYI